MLDGEDRFQGFSLGDVVSLGTGWVEEGCWMLDLGDEEEDILFEPLMNANERE